MLQYLPEPSNSSAEHFFDETDISDVVVKASDDANDSEEYFDYNFHVIIDTTDESYYEDDKDENITASQKWLKIII